MSSLVIHRSIEEFDNISNGTHLIRLHDETHAIKCNDNEVIYLKITKAQDVLNQGVVKKETFSKFINEETTFAEICNLEKFSSLRTANKSIGTIFNYQNIDQVLQSCLGI